MLRHLLLVLFVMLTGLAHAADTGKPKVILNVVGKVTTPQAFSLAELDKLPQKKMTVSTPWYPEPQTFEGPLLRDVLQLAKLKGDTLKLQALNDYTIDVPAADSQQYDVIVASRLNGKTMSIREKGPLFIMYPFDQHEKLRKTEYYRRCAWQLKQIIVE
ncbi:molybdopterin-dependent oxidoreductase [Chitinibacter sp. GC72]|uniref:molybdopterin-dependent oxidoreductase n=1 Tax=Chitinibacter sp. GC72 TaxID=1526917 RepID=UPI0012FC9CD6|nr:molybdopterin-dependent oxidoreductase [Chitinibacter sp. GC72]